MKASPVTSIVAACAVTVPTMTACAIDTGTASDTLAERMSVTDCRAMTPYVDIDAMAGDFTQASSVVGLVGGDLAVTTQSRSNLLMAFGDSLLDTPASPESIVRNSLLAFARDRACLVLGPQGSAFVPDRPDGVGYWPTSLVEVTPEATVAMFLQRVEERGDHRFANLGPALAEITLDPDGIPHVVRVIDIGIDNPTRRRIGWGAASWRADDGHIYIFGTANPERDLVFGWSLHVARTRPDRIFDVESWEYWSADGWSEDASDVAAVIPAVGGVDQTLSVFHDADTWYAVSKRDGYLGRDVVLWTSPAPTGPFTASKVLVSRPSDPVTERVAYAALAHPVLFPEPGTMVISVSHNTTDPDALSADPTLYRPEFIRVPLP